MLKEYRAIHLMTRHGSAIAIALAAAAAALIAWLLSFLAALPVALVIGAAGGMVVLLFVSSYVEMMRIVADTLIPR